MRGMTKLRHFLLINGITQRELSGTCGLTENLISLIATGRLSPNKRQREKVLEALKLKDEKMIFD
jgi:transcriptional regulator with XRE-family HTH domain